MSKQFKFMHILVVSCLNVAIVLRMVYHYCIAASFWKGDEIIMISKCNDCPRTKEFIKLEGSPCCGAENFYMNVNTHIAECPICKKQWGVPKAIESLCNKDRLNKKYSITIGEALRKEHILGLSKLLGMNGARVYHLFKENSPVVFDNIPMILAYKVRNYFRDITTSIQISPSLDEYHLFEDCWKI